MIGLHRAGRDDRVGPLPERIGQRVLQLASLVTARCEARAVVAFDPDRGTAEAPGKTRQRLERRREMAERDTGKFLEQGTAPQKKTRA